MKKLTKARLTGSQELFTDLKTIKQSIKDRQKIKHLTTRITPVPRTNAPVRLVPPRPVIKKPELDQEEILE